MGSEAHHSWINRFRRLLIRWEKKQANYLAFLQVAAFLLFTTKRHFRMNTKNDLFCFNYKYILFNMYSYVKLCCTFRSTELAIVIDKVIVVFSNH
jgi:hypothetical protein